MATPTHRRILAATATVLGFWSLVFTVVLWLDAKNWGLFLLNFLVLPPRFVWVLAAAIAASGFLLLWEAAEEFHTTLHLRPRTRRGAKTTTLGMLPRPENVPTVKALGSKQRESRWKEIAPTLGEDPRLDVEAVQQLAFGVGPRTEFFWSVFEILDSSSLPASPFRGSHGDSTLLAHSLRVAAALAKLWPSLDTTRLPTRAGEAASSRSFDLGTAILAGLAHDIGKVLCFQMTKKGIEVVGLHDIEGSRLLGRLDSFWALTDERGRQDDALQHLLTQAIRYYHHPYAYPASGPKRAIIHTDESVTDLMQAIRAADLVAGAIEGREEEILADYRDNDELPERDLEEQIWESFQFFLSNVSYINHKSPDRRLGYKQDGILYLAEKRLRGIICDHLSITRSDYLGSNNGNPGKVIQVIAQRLDALGLLKKDFQGKTCGKPEGAGFYLRIEGTTKDGEAKEVDEKIPYYLFRITEDGLFASYAEMENYRSRILVVAPTWPQYFPRQGGTAKVIPLAKKEPESEVEGPEDDRGASSAESSPATEESSDPEASVDPEQDQGSPWEGAEQTGDREPEQSSIESGKTESEEESAPTPPVQQSKGRKPRHREQQPMTPEQKAERRRQQEIARAHANRKQQSLNRVSMRTTEQKFAIVKDRVKSALQTYPHILEEIPGRAGPALPVALRKRLLFAAFWLDELQQGRRHAEGSTSIFRGTLSELLTDTPENILEVIREALEGVGPGVIPILEIRIMFDIQPKEPGSIDYSSSLFIAPIREDGLPAAS